ncbi:MAG: patatin-like phospholipase family protein [Cellulosilyticaceae bacterium]
MSKFRIISFNSEGVHGAFSSRLLLRLTNKFPELLQNTHLFSGTSMGAFNALALSYNVSPHKIDSFYSYENSKYIFTPKSFNPFTPKYQNINYEKKLASIFPRNLTLSNLKKYVFIPTFNVQGYYSPSPNLVFFNNITNNPTITEKVIDTVLCSSATPPFFPSHHNFIDCNLIQPPSVISPIMHLRSLAPHQYNLKDFRLLSIGSSFPSKRIVKNTKKWGMAQWNLNMFNSKRLSTYINTSPTIEELTIKELIGPNFFNLNEQFDYPVRIDSYKDIPELIEIANKVDLTSTYRYIERFYLPN